MWEAHKQEVIERAGAGLVLDIGGWADPLPRADYVVDLCPYETRGLGYNGVHTLPASVLYREPREGERFTRDTWIIHDICSVAPLPFPDKKFDYAVCSHTLEDIRDPLRVCHELIRVARAGYIECPARVWEQTMRPSGVVGESHHRWMVQVEGGHIRFFGKPHFLHADRKFHLPLSFFEARYREVDKVCWLFWEDRFTFEEPSTYWDREVADYVAAFKVPTPYYWKDKLRPLRRAWWRLRSGLCGGGGEPSPAGTADEPLWTWERLFEANARLLAERTRPAGR